MPGRCDVELELVAVPHGAGVALVIQDVRINDQAVPMLRGARVQLRGQARSSATLLELVMVPSTVLVRMVEPEAELTGDDMVGGGY